MIAFIYIVSIAYCLWRIFKSYKRSFGDGNPIGSTPGLDTIFVILFAPLMAAVDIIVTWIQLIKKSNEDNDPVF
jgi:hypothetical protein